MSLEVSATYVALRGLGGVLSVATLAILARAYGPSAYAEVAVAIAAALLIASTMFSPLRSALARFPTGSDTEVVLANIFYRFSACVCIVGSVGAIVAGHRFPLILAATALATMQGAFDYAVQHATSAFDPRRVGGLYVTKSLLSVTGALAVMWIGAPSWCAVAVLAVSSLVAVAWLGRGAFSAGWVSLRSFGDESRQLLSFAAPLAVVGILVFGAQWADRTVVGAFLGAAAFGAYVAVADLTQQLAGMLFSGVAAAWYPRLVDASAAGADREVRRIFDRYVELLWVLLVPAVIGLAAVSPSLAAVAFGARFQIEGSWMPLLAIGAGFAGMKAFLLDVPLFLRKRMVLHASIVATTASLSTAFAYVLLPRFGVAGAAAAYCAASFVGCALSWLAIRDFSRVVPKGRTLVGILVGALAMLIVTTSVVAPNVQALAIAVAIGASVYGCVLWLLDVSDVRSLGRRISKFVDPMARRGR